MSGAERYPRKTNKACVPCRTRKVKCDATEVGLPCSSCKIRKCTKDCLSLERKGRVRKRKCVVSTPTQSPTILDTRRAEMSPTSDCQRSGQTGSDLFYLQVLSDAVDKTATSGRLHTTSDIHSKPEESLTPRTCLYAQPPRLDLTDKEYLGKRGVFDLPSSSHLDALVQTYFNHVHPFCAVINRAEFIRCYEGGNCSLLLLHVILTTASLYASDSMLSKCGFANHSIAQDSFFLKAKLLFDFAVEDDLLSLLQGSIILCMVILEHPTDRDFGYWFHNAICLATKFSLLEMCTREDTPSHALRLYRRIWWCLYSIDTFHVSVNTQRSLLLDDNPPVRLSMEDIWENEDLFARSYGLLSAVTPQQKASLVVHGELAQIFRQSLSIVKNKPQRDPSQMMRVFDDWRKSLASKMFIDRDTRVDPYYLNVQALSYRYECVLCRQIRRQSGNEDWTELAKQRLRSAMLELDTIIMRVLAEGTLQQFPIVFITTITTLVALHIELAIDPSVSALVSSMARISISQAMLLLSQREEIPVLKRALPIFHQILTRKQLSLVPFNSHGYVSAQPPSHHNTAGGHTSQHTQLSRVSPQLEQWRNDPLFDTDFLGLDLLDQSLQFLHDAPDR